MFNNTKIPREKKINKTNKRENEKKNYYNKSQNFFTNLYF